MLQGEHSAILSTFNKLPSVIKIFVLSIFEWPFYTGFTVFGLLHFLLLSCSMEDAKFDLESVYQLMPNTLKTNEPVHELWVYIKACKIRTSIFRNTR